MTESNPLTSKTSTEELLSQLIAEREKLGEDFPHCFRLLSYEIDRVLGGKRTDDNNYLELHHDQPVKVSCKILIPIKEYPRHNFVGRILGPKGNSLKRLQEKTQTKISVCGRGYMKDKEREEELMNSGDPKWSHLKETLHIYVEAHATADNAFARLGFACHELHKYLLPVRLFTNTNSDDIAMNQFQEMAMMNSGVAPTFPRMISPLPPRPIAPGLPMSIPMQLPKPQINIPAIPPGTAGSYMDLTSGPDYQEFATTMNAIEKRNSVFQDPYPRNNSVTKGYQSQMKQVASSVDKYSPNSNRDHPYRR